MKSNKSFFLARAVMALLCTLMSTSVMADEEPQVSSTVCYYNIYTEEDWNKAAEDVKDGKLGAFDEIKINLFNDISVSTMMASSNVHYLKGIIEGNGHTITVNFGSKDSPVTDPYVGLFRFVREFVVNKLNVVGDIYTKEQYAGGIVAESDDEVIFQDCMSGVVIHSSFNGEGTHGGFVAKANVARFFDCVFYGKLLTTNGTQKCGGFAGWIDNDLWGTDLYIDRCLYAPAPLEDGETEPTNSCTIYRNEKAGLDAEKVFYTRTLGTAQGISCSGKSPQQIVAAMESQSWAVFAGRAVPTQAWRICSNDTSKYKEFLAGTGTEEDPYIIYDTGSWNTFTCWTHRGAGEGIYYKMTENIQGVQIIAASEAQPFCGIFNGGHHTLTVSFANTDGNERTAPFSYVDGATIQNLIVDGSITGTASLAAASRAAGVIGDTNGSTSHIINCVSSVDISGDDYIGGFSIGGNVEIEGCVFNGTINSEGNSGGFVGYSQSTLKITNSLFAPLDGSSISGGTFYYNGTAGTLTNCYYTQALGTAQGKAARSITAGENVSVGHAGEATTYNVSRITAYKATDAHDDSDPFIDGIVYNDVLYAGSDDQVSLTLANTAGDAPAGYQYSGGYSTSAGTLTGSANPYTLTMPDDDVNITAMLTVIPWSGKGLKDDPWVISYPSQLLLLAYHVNGSHGETYNGYDGMYFKLGADIAFDPNDLTLDEGQSNYEAIGCYVGSARSFSGHRTFGGLRSFSGNFDGDGHTVSGIRLCKTGTNSSLGLFAFIGNANIHDVHLTDARIEGSGTVGGIVGWNNSGTITGCTVTESAITATEATSNYGVICGDNNSGTLSHNYYHACTVNGTANATNVGCEGADVTANDGAVPMPSLSDTGDNTTVIATLATRGDQGLPTTYPVVLEGHTLYKDGYWNTLTLPFAVTDGDDTDDKTFSGTPLEGATVKELLTTSNLDGNAQLTLNFTNAASIEAGKPYIVKWGTPANNPNSTIQDPVFTGVTISSTTPTTVNFTGGTFKGNYAPLEITDALGNKNSIVLLAAGNKLGYATTDRTVANGKALGAFHAYFEIPAVAGAPAISSFELNTDDESTQTGIISTTDFTDYTDKSDAWYTINGVKLNGKPTTKGLFIYNGKKRVIK